VSASGEAWSITPGRGCRRMGEGVDGSAGVTAIRGADGVDGGDSDNEGDVVPLIALMTDARGDADGAGVGRASLNGEGEGDPNGDAEERTAGDAFFMAMGLILLPPSAISARGRRWGESPASSLLVVETEEDPSLTTNTCSLCPSSSESESSYDALVSPRSIRRPFGSG